MSQITGTITSIFPNDINTDDIIPAYTLQESTERSYFKKYAFSNYDPDFVKRCATSDSNIIVAGENFGCGSSREQAVYALSENNVKVIIAQSYPDIFYRNSLNNGLILIKVDDISDFKLNNKVTIDFEKQIIISGNTKIHFEMKPEEIETFTSGGKLVRVKSHQSRLLSSSLPRRSPDITRTKAGTPQTIVEKIISDHVGKPILAGDKISELPIDLLFFNEVIGPAAIKDFQNNFGDTPVFDAKKVFFIPDHTVPSSSVAVSEGITLMEEFARKKGIFCYKEGDGVEHVVLAEDGHITPGKIILGTDSHTDTNGAFNTLAFGVGTTDGTYALATGHLYDFEVPGTIRINFIGNFNKGVYAKDVILYILQKLGVDGASKKVVEFGGVDLKNISLEGRATISNMAVELGARTAIFEPDDILSSYFSNYADVPYTPYFPDSNCIYEKIIEVDLSTLEPNVAFPHRPDNITPISKVKDVKVTDAFIGSCTNGRYEDFVEASKIIKGKKVHQDVNFIIIPASRKIYNKLLKNGILQIFAEAGANIESSNCGPCFGKHMGVVGSGAQMISTSNRNYIGRMGSKNAKIFLASPATVAASAITGKITDPRIYIS